MLENEYLFQIKDKTPPEVEKLNNEIIAKINSLNHEHMASAYRFAPSGHIYFLGDLPFFDVFMKRFRAFGGMSAEISKKIGL